MKKIKQNKHINILIVLAICSVLLLIITVLLVYYRENKTEYGTYDENIQKISGEIAEEWTETDSELGDKRNFSSAMVICRPDVTIVTKTNSVEFYYQNPSASQYHVKLQMYIGEQLVAESKVIPPGYEIRNIDTLSRIIAEEGIYNGVLKTIFYDENFIEQDADFGVNVKITIKN